MQSVLVHQRKGLRNTLAILLVFLLYHQGSAQRITAAGGSFTIDAAGTNTGTNFTSFTAAISELNGITGLSGSITFNVTAGQVFTEQPPVITASGNAAAGITFTRWGAGANPVIVAAGTGASLADAAITLSGGDYFTFNGIDVTAADSSLEFGYLVRKAGRQNGAHHNTITNATILMHKLKSVTYAVLQTPDSVIGAAPAAYAAGAGTQTNSYNTYTHLTIGNSFNGIWLKGQDNLGDTSNRVNNNTIGRAMANDNGADGINAGAFGIQLGWQYAPSVNDNTVRNLMVLNVAGTSVTVTGIHYSNCFSGTISNNIIHTIGTTRIAGNNSNMTTYGINAAVLNGAGISGNSISGITTNIFTALNATGVNTNAKLFNNIISNCAATGEGNGIFIAGATGCRVSGSSVSAITTTATSQLYAIRITGGANDSIDNNTIRNITATSYVQGIYTATTNNFRIYQNTIEGLASSTNVYGINLATISNNTRVYSNLVRNLHTTGSTSAIYGFNMAPSSGTIFLYGNTAHDISNRMSGTGAVHGWAFSSSAAVTVNLYNNIVYNLAKTYSGAATATRLVSGITLSSTANATAMYNIIGNAVYIDAGAGAAYSSQVLFNAATNNATAPVTVLRNNIFVNATGAQAGAAKHYIIYASGAAGVFGNTASSSNYNCFRIANTANGYIGYSSGDRASLTDWTSAFPSYDANTITADPLFNGISNLRIMPGSPAAGTGTFVSGFTTDILGITRHASTPSMGPYEVAMDVTSPSISYAKIPHVFHAANYVLDSFAQITDAANGSISTIPGQAPRIYYKLKAHDNTFGANHAGVNGWKYTEAANSISPFNFTIDYSLLYGPPVTVGDTLVYFVAAQDTASVPNITASPAEGFAASSLSNIISAPSGLPYYTILSNPSLYLGSDAARVSVSNVGQGTGNNVMLRVKVTTGATGTSAYVSRLTLTSNGGGDDSSNTESASVYFTGPDSSFAANELFGSIAFAPAAAGPTGTFHIRGNALTQHGDNYFWVVYKIRPGAIIGDSVNADLVSLVYHGTEHPYTGSTVPGARKIRMEYCASSAFAPTLEDIGQLTFQQSGSTIFTSAGSCTPPFSNPLANNQYTDRTSLPPIQVKQNAAVDFSACISSSSTSLFGSYLAIFIDYNQNGLWEPDEIAYASKGTNYYDTTFTGKFRVPCDALPGETRMRVVLRSSSLNYVVSALDACYSNSPASYYYGETEDYLVNIIANPVSYLSSEGIQQTGTIASGVSDQAILRIPVVADGCGTGTVTGFHFSTSGTAVPADIAAAKLYATGTSPSFNTHKLLGTAYAPHGAFSFQLLNDTLRTGANDTNNYWLSYDIAVGATDHNTIDATVDSIGLLGSNKVPAQTNPAGHKTVLTPMQFLGSEAFHAHTSNVTIGSGHVNILGLRVITTAAGAPVALTSLDLGTAGTTLLSDITNLKVWYTGNNKTFATATQFGSTIITPGASHTVNGHQLLANDTNYFWITSDVPATATTGNTIDASVSSVIVNNVLHAPSVTAPAGSRRIIKAYCPSVPSFPFRPAFASEGDDIGKVMLNQNGTTLLNHGTGCLPQENNTSATGTYVDYTSTAPVADLVQNEPVTFSICAISSSNMTGGLLTIYIDFNQDADFDTTERVYTSATSTIETGTFSGSFTVPCSAIPGQTRMRVILGPNQLPCSNGGYIYGETEDYLVNLVQKPLAYLSSTARQINRSVAPGAANAPVLHIPVAAEGCGLATTSEFRFSTAGSTFAPDIAIAKLYRTGASAIFNTGNLLAAYNNPSGPFTITATDTLATNPGDTNNYWLTFDLNASAANGNFVDATFDSLELFGQYHKPLAGDPAGSRLIELPMTYVSSTTTQNILSRVETGSAGNNILGLRIETSATGAPIDLTSLTVSTNGTSALSDIRNLRVWYTGNNASFDTATRFGATAAAPAATQVISQIQALSHGVNYFWITYDIAANAVLSNAVDAEITSLTVDGTARTPVVTAPAGARLIKAPYCVSGATNEFAVGEDIGQFSLSQKGATILSNGSCTPAANNSSANRSYTDFSTSVAPIAIQKNTPVNFSICAIRPTAGSYNCYAAIYIDYNHNGLWETGEMVYASPATTNVASTFTGRFAVPCTALNGETRMRVMLVSTFAPTLNSACNATVSNYTYGETEDYTVNILPSPVSYTSSEAVQNTSNVAAGSTDAVILHVPVIANGCGTAVANAFHFSTSGTTQPGDILSAKLYQTGTSAAFVPAKLVASVPNPSGTFSFTGLTDTLHTDATDTTHYWLAYDIASSAQVGHALDAAFDSLRLNATTHVPMVTSPAGNRTVIVPMTYTGTEITQQNTARAEQGATNIHVAGIKITTSATGSPVNLSSLTVSTNGTTTLADVTNLRIWYTGTSNVFATTTQFGPTVASPGVAESITGTQPLQNGINYFWLSYDVPLTATVGNLLDAEVYSLVVDGISRTPAVTAPAGARQIITAYCPSGATTTLDDDIGNVTVTDGTNTLLNNGTATPATNNPAADKQYTSFVESVPSFGLVQGRSYQVNITSIFSAGTYNSTRSVYIDYNNNGNFSDPGELAWTSVPSLSSGTSTGTFQVPVNAVPGTTRMRVILIKGSTPLSSSGACLSYANGETEDYAVTIAPAPPAATYTWNVTTASGAYATAANWTPARTFPSVTDILVVNNGGTRSMTGVPAQLVQSLYLDNNTTLNLSGTGALTVSDSLHIGTGSRINTNSMAVVLGTDSSRYGTFDVSGSYSGTLRQWVNPAVSVYHFPMMTGNNKKTVTVTYQATPGQGGTIEVSFSSGNPGAAGLPATDAGLSLSIERVSQEGVWNVQAGNGLSGGVFGISIESEQTPGINNVYETALVYRPNALSSWTLPGTAAISVGSASAITLSRSGLSAYGQFTIGGTTTNPLPVSLLAFKGTKAGNDVELDWETASETSNKGFEIERSADGLYFTAAGFVAGQGTVAAGTRYRHTDIGGWNNQVNGKLFYRLKQVDRNNSFSYSNTIVIGEETVPGFAASAHPNPFSETFYLDVQSAADAPLTLVVYDVTGRQVMREELALTAGANTLRVSCPDALRSGVYFVRIATEQHTETIRLVKH